jgi:hypothetical protein
MTMNLISCDNCGVVLDANKLGFPAESRKYLDNGTVDTDNFIWDGDEHIAFVKCPVCNEKITKE